MAEKPAKPETVSANLIAFNKDSPFQILNVRSLTDSIDDEVGALDIEDAKTPDENEDTDAGETAPEEEDGAEEDTAAEKDETVQKTTVQDAITADRDPREEATAVEETSIVQDNASAPGVAADKNNASVEKDAVGIVAENTEKTIEHHQYSAQMSDNAYSTDEEPELVIDMSFEEEDSPKKGERTTSSKDAAESVTEQTGKKTPEHPDPMTDGSAEPITLSNESDDNEEEVTRNEATLKVMPKAEQVSEDDDDDVEFVEEASEVRDGEGKSIKEDEEDEMEQMENSLEMRILISIIAGLRVACNELLEMHHTVQVDFANTTVDTKNFEDCLKWVQVYLRGPYK